MQIRALLILFFICCLGCNNKADEKKGTASKPVVAFDKTKWKTKEGDEYPYRDKMLQDLIDHVKLKGLKKDEVVDLLGQPDRTDSSYLFYRIAQKRIGFFPLSTKTLVIKFAEDSTVEWRKIHG